MLGGARSGKSSFAERRLLTAPAVTYVACGPAPDAEDPEDPEDPEWAERVRLHRARRPGHWQTIETQDLPGMLGDLPAALDGGRPALLVDCLSTWLATAMDDCGIWAQRPGADERLAGRIDELAAAWSSSRARVVAVSNEVGSGVVPATASGRRYRDELGVLNARIAAASDEVWLITAGLGQRLR